MALASRSIETRSRFDWRRSLAFAAALALLNASLTFENFWPTPAIVWRGQVSIELAVVLLAAAIGWRVLGAPTRRMVNGLSALWLALVLGRYADVTAPALYGRDINLYWDVRYASDVTAMLTRAAPWGLIVLVGLAALVLLVALFLLIRWAIRTVATGLEQDGQRTAAAALAAAALLWFAAQAASVRVSAVPAFSRPVTATYARQARLMMEARAAKNGARVLAPSPAMNSDFTLVAQTDVFLIFIESYGAITYDRPDFARRLTASRERLLSAVRDTDRDVVSTFVASPTFGGSSWLAHISLMSGIEVRDPDTDALLMTQQRDTLAKAFARAGHHTVAWMPGLKQAWPEGVFYGFDEIDGARKVDYHGPEFGWFAIPDQFSLARLDQIMAERSGRTPYFVFFPTLSTHTPFSPKPPYDEDWARVLTREPFDPGEVDKANDEEIDWLNLSPNYVAAVEYANIVLAGYLRLHRDRDFVLILMGDHQPPALVSGAGASWDVPVHVIASRSTARAEVLNRLRAHGFQTGLTPRRAPLGPMHTLLPILLDALGSRH